MRSHHYTFGRGFARHSLLRAGFVAHTDPRRERPTDDKPNVEVQEGASILNHSSEATRYGLLVSYSLIYVLLSPYRKITL